MDYGKQASLVDALCNTILRQGDMPSPAEWDRIKALAECIQEQLLEKLEQLPLCPSVNGKEWVCFGGMDEFDRAYLRATGRAL